MKKLTALVLAAAMILTMAGCSSQSEETAAVTVPQSTQAAEQAPATTAAPETEAATEAETPAQEIVQIPQEPSIQLHPIAQDYYECAQREDNTMIYVARATLLSLNEEETAAYPLLETALAEDYSEYVYSTIREFIENWKKNTEGQNLDIGGDDPFRQTVQIVRMDSNMASLLTSTYEFLGGQHGYTALRSFNYKTDEMRWVQLSEIVKDNEKLQQILKERLEKEYPDSQFFDLAGDIKKYVLDQPASDGNISYTWTMDYDSVQIYFGEQELAPYASGIQMIDLKFTDYPELFTYNYGAAPENYITAVQPYIPYNAGDISYEFDPRMDMYGSVAELAFTVNGTESTFPVFGYETNAWFVTSGEDHFFYTFLKKEDDEERLMIFRIEDGGMKQELDIEARLKAEYGQVDPVGTPFGYKSYASRQVHEVPADPAALRVEVRENGSTADKTVSIEGGAVMVQ